MANKCNKFVVLSGLALMCGCSSFDREWKAAGDHPPAGIEGRWNGTWTSQTGGGHTGGLRCVITREDANTYRAYFAATFWKIFHFSHISMLKGSDQPAGVVKLSGQEDLGWLAGGIYFYDGESDPTHFKCDYKSSKDHGVFEMKRPD